MIRFVLILSSVAIIRSISRSDLVRKRSVEDWSVVRSHRRTPITAPPTPFPPRFTVPTRPNQANVPSATTHVPYSPNISKTTSKSNIQPPTLPPSRNANMPGIIMPSRSSKRPHVPLPTLPPPVQPSRVRYPIVFPSPEPECPSILPNMKRQGNARPWQQRRKRFALEGSQWSTRRVSYRVSKYPPNNSKEKVDVILRKAFNIWQEAADISFSQLSGGEANIEIRFEEGSHGDAQPFDGPQGMWSRHHSGLGHSRSPQFGGDIHFDAGERWNCADLLLMASLHQIGHAIGLNPSRDPQSVMFPLYSHTDPRVELGADDILGLQQIYRRPKKTQISKEGWL